MNKKVFVIGLDGATWNIIDPLISEGELPTIRSLIGNGTRAVLQSTLIPLSPAAWTSFSTGCNPNKHGIFDFFGRKKGTYESVVYSSRDRKCESLWSILSKQGKKVGILNVPGTYPVEKVNGFMITGFPTPEELEDYTYPTNLLSELKTELGKDFRFQPKVQLFDEKLFLREVHVLTEYVFQATNYLMNHNQWDFLMTVFVGPDALSHAFWKYMDPKHPLYDTDAPAELKNAIVDIYKELDKKIELLKKNIDSDTTLILMSDHGFGPLYYGVPINNWLLNEGFMTLKKTMPTRIRYWMFQRGINYYNLLKITKVLRLSKYAHKAAFASKSSSVDFVNKFFLTNKDVDWSRTVAYCMGSFGQLFINLKGREPQGIIESGEEYDKLVNDVIMRLSKFKDPNNNNIIFEKSFSKKQAYPQSNIDDNTPDILFYDNEMKYSIDKFFMFGSKELVSIHPIWSGTHRHDGIFIAWAENHIRKASRLEKADICDIAPTVLHLMGLPIPQDMDGKVLVNIFEKDSDIYRQQISDRPPSQMTEVERINKRIKELKRIGKI